MNDVFPDDIVDLRFNNFQIAFGITAYDGSTEPSDNERYGRVFARYETWDSNELNKFREIETHKCTEEELGFTE